MKSDNLSRKQNEILIFIKKFMAENPEKFDPRGYFGAARSAICDLVKTKILNVLGSFKKSEFVGVD